MQLLVIRKLITSRYRELVKMLGTVANLRGINLIAKIRR
jgi:hypothetical protein